MSENMDDLMISKPPRGLAILTMVGPSMIWCAEYIGTGEVILATRTGTILGTGVLWAIIIGIFLKYWIGMSGARYTVCTGEGMIDMFDRMPGPRHWAVWIVLIAQFASATISIGAVASAAGVFVNSLVPVGPRLGGWLVSFFALAIAWTGFFGILKMVMSFFVLVTVLGVLYVAVHVFPGFSELLQSLSFQVPPVPDWALEVKGINENPWREILPLIGWGAGGFASQVWYTYWVLGAEYGATKGRGYGRSADVAALKNLTRENALKIKQWCRVVYTDATLALLIGITVTGGFLIAGAGILRPGKVIPDGESVALTLSTIFSERWGKIGGVLFLIAGSSALISTLVGQLAGWPRLLADSFRICIPSIGRKFSWKTQFRFFLLFFFCSNMIIVFKLGMQPVILVKFSAILDGLLLTPFQALCIGIGLFAVMPKILSAEAAAILKPSIIFAVGLVAAFFVFAYFCAFQIPFVF